MTVAFLARVNLLRGVELAGLEEWAGACRQKSYGRQETIFLEGAPADAFYIIKSGLVKIYRLTQDGREKILGVFGEGDFFGEMGLLDDSPRSAGAVSLRRAELLVMDKPDFRRLLDKYPQVALNLSRVLSERLRRANEQIQDLAFRDTRARIIRTLVTIAAERSLLEPGRDRIVLPLSHQELAGLAGTSRETVTRVVAELEKRGVVQSRRGSLLVNRAAIGAILLAGEEQT